MSSNNNTDQFAYRSEGGYFSMGSDENDHVSGLVKVDDQLLCITQKNIRTVLMADDVDPDRTNPNINHNIQEVIPYGSENKFVGKTLQQASILFEENSLLPHIDHNKGISIALSFLKEILSLDKVRDEYIIEQNDINESLIEMSSNGSISPVPCLPNLEQKLKNFILNADRAKGLIMDLVILFYPDIELSKNKPSWEEQLHLKVKKSLGKKEQFTIFINDFKKFTQLLREIRNCIEHSKDPGFKLELKNYVLTPKNDIDMPSISFIGKKNNLAKMRVVDFLELTTDNLLGIFELLMAYLSNFHANTFADNKRIVIDIPEDKRPKNERHVRFRYEIIWKE
jgi:hypothetical protein